MKRRFEHPLIFAPRVAYHADSGCGIYIIGHLPYQLNGELKQAAGFVKNSSDDSEIADVLERMTQLEKENGIMTTNPRARPDHSEPSEHNRKDGTCSHRIAGARQPTYR